MEEKVEKNVFFSESKAPGPGELRDCCCCFSSCEFWVSLWLTWWNFFLNSFCISWKFMHFCFFELPGVPYISRTSGTLTISGASFSLSKGSFAKNINNNFLFTQKLLVLNPNFLSYKVSTPGLKETFVSFCSSCLALKFSFAITHRLAGSVERIIQKSALGGAANQISYKNGLREREKKKVLREKSFKPKVEKTLAKATIVGLELIRANKSGVEHHNSSGGMVTTLR